MLCRLCLREGVGDGLQNVFNEAGELVAEQIHKSIKTFLDIELFHNDEISTKICHTCWEHLHDFNRFCEDVAEKQQQLKEQLEAKKLSVVSAEVSVIAYAGEDFTNDDDTNLEDTALCEPQIDINETSSHENEVDEINDAFESSSSIGSADSSSSKTKTTHNTRQTKDKTCLRPRNPSRKTVKSDEGGIPKTKRSLRELGLELDAYIAEHIELACCICKQTLENFTQLKIHFRLEHSCVGYMPCCNNRYKKRSRLVEHLKVHNDPNFYKCTICEKVLINRSSYNSHMHRTHPTEDQLNFKCPVCSEKFAKQYILDLHMNKHHGEEQAALECKVCRKIYPSASSLRDHMTYIHLNVSNKICDYCGQVLRSKQGLDYHIRSKHQIGQQDEMQCNLCGKWLKNKRGLYKHKYMHQQEASNKKFTCPTCGVEKTTRSKLSGHIRYHHNEKDYICSFCSKQFKCKVSLDEHLATHSGKDLYSCPFCSRTFKSHANLHKHKKKVHPTQWVPRNTQPTQKETTSESLSAP